MQAILDNIDAGVKAGLEKARKANTVETFVGRMRGSSHVQLDCGCATLSWGVIEWLRGVAFRHDPSVLDDCTVTITVTPNARNHDSSERYQT